MYRLNMIGDIVQLVQLPLHTGRCKAGGACRFSNVFFVYVFLCKRFAQSTLWWI